MKREGRRGGGTAEGERAGILRVSYRVMWWTGIDAAKANGFVGFQTICDLRRTNLRDVPKQPGVYLILRTLPDPATFLATSTGGHFKGKDPAVDRSVLDGKWVPHAAVV